MSHIENDQELKKILKEVGNNTIVQLTSDDPNDDYFIKNEDQNHLESLKNMNPGEGAHQDDIDAQYQVQMLNLQLLKDAMVVQEEQLSRLKEQRDVWKRSVLLWDSLQGEAEVLGKIKEIPHFVSKKEEFRLHLVLQHQLQQQLQQVKEEQRDEEERDKKLFQDLKTTRVIQERIAKEEKGEKNKRELSVRLSDLNHQVELLRDVNKDLRERALDYKGKAAKLKADNEGMKEEITHTEQKIQRSLEWGVAERTKRKKEEIKKADRLRMTMGGVETRIAYFKEVLEADKIDLSRVGQMCSFGIPDGCLRERAICWRLLLGYLPTKKEDWEDVLADKRALYQSFCRELDPDRCFWKWKPEERTFSVAASSSSFSTLPSFEPSSSSSSSSVPLSASSPPSTGGRFSVSSLPILAKLIQEQQLPSPSPPPRKVTPRNEGKGGEEENKEGEEEGKEREGEGEGEGKGEGEGEGEENPEKLDADHFMSIIPKITKNQEGKKGDGPLSLVKERLLVEVCKDVPRTLPDLNFFCDGNGAGVTDHYFAVARILYIYAALNPGIGYVQGMNEIVAPMYYLFVHDTKVDDEWKEHAEADAFFCFTSIMGEIRDFFCKSLDASSVGIRYQISRLSDLLEKADPEVWNDFQEKQLLFEYFAFRWISVLLSQEFKIEQIFRIWDVLFADTVENDTSSHRRFSFLVYICCAMIIAIRDQLLAGAFSDNVKLLLRYPDSGSINDILSQAKALREKIPVEEIFSSP